MATRDSAKSWLRLDGDADDDLVDDLLSLAEAYIRAHSVLEASDPFPQALNIAQLTVVAHWYENRGDGGGVQVPDIVPLMVGYLPTPSWGASDDDTTA